MATTGDDQAQNDYGAGHAVCDKCGEDKPVCCGEFLFSDTEPTEYAEALCMDCCDSKKERRMNVGCYERMDCDV